MSSLTAKELLLRQEPKASKRMPGDKVPPESFSFSVSGWLKLYFIGVGLALSDFELNSGARFAGASGGTLVCLSSIANCNFLMLKEVIKGYAQCVHRDFSKAFRVNEIVEDGIKKTIPEDVFYSIKEELEARISISITVLPGFKNMRKSEFRDYAHFVQCILASCNAWPIAGLPIMLDGHLTTDGGLSDYQPVFDEHTVTISPFYFEKADIKPSRFVPMWWGLYPPSCEELDRLFIMGYDDALRWLHSQDYQPPEGYLLPAWSSFKPVTEACLPEASRPAVTIQHHGCLLVMTDLDEELPDTLSKYKDSTIDMALVFVFFCVFKPLAYWLLICELVLKLALFIGKYLYQELVLTFPKEAREMAIKSIASKAAFILNSAYGFYKKADFDHDQLYDESYVYRMFINNNH